MKLKPRIKSPLIMAFSTIIIIRINNTGIMKLITLSIPEMTPKAIMKILRLIKTVCQKSKLVADAVA